MEARALVGEATSHACFRQQALGVRDREKAREGREGEGGQCALRDKTKCYRLTPAESHNSGALRPEL